MSDADDAGRPELSGRFATLAEALAPHAVAMDTLERRHGQLLEIGRQLLGVVPRCHQFLELWPPAFATYNVLVPNLLNVPAIVRPRYRVRELVSIAMLVSSWAAGCRYCTAHACAFGQLRGVDPRKLVAAMGPDRDQLTTGEGIVVVAAEGLGTMPSTLTQAQRSVMESLHNTWSANEVEYIVLAIALMGFLNKLMDSLGVPLEPRMMSAASRSIADGGWQPGRHATNENPDHDWDPRRERTTILKLAPLLPAVLWRSRNWTRAVPVKRRPLQRFLHDHTGYHWPLLTRIRSGRARQAIGTMLCLNLNPQTSTLGLRTKMQAAKIYAEHTQNDWLHRVITRNLVLHAKHVDLATGHRTPEGTQEAALLLATAASHSPAQLDPATIHTVASLLQPAQIIELDTWLACLQLWHRLSTYYNTPSWYRNRR